MEFLTDKLVKEPPFGYTQGIKAETFYPALVEELCFHYDNNPLYKKFCDNKGFNPHNSNNNFPSTENAGIERLRSLSQIPPVQVSVFKELGQQLNSVPRENIKLTLQSSATSGIPSSVPLDVITSKRQAKSMVHVIGDYIGNERKPFLIMDVDPASGFRNLLGARYAAVSGYLNFASEAGYFLKIDEATQRYYFDIDGIKDFIAKLGEQSAVVFGFTYILYSEVLRPLSEQGLSFQLTTDSKIIHIGGWKKLEDEKISKEQFNDLASRVFGVKSKDVIDVYGFTEQMGLNYPDCPCGCKHTPLYSEVIVRDVITKEPLPAGQEGLLEFISPVPHSYPGNVVLTDDIGMIVDGDCEYHRGGTRFKVMGRLKKAEIRGCGDILSNKLKFAETSTTSTTTTNTTSTTTTNMSGSGAFNYYYKENTVGVSSQTVDTSTTPASITPEEKIEVIAQQLRTALTWLRKQSVDALIGLISKVATNKWCDDSFASLSISQVQGLKFLISWCNGEYLTQIANEGLRGNRHFADGFISVDDYGTRSMRATSRGLVCHWLAGNVQVLGMFVLIQSLLAKNVNLLRISSRDNGVFEALLRAFEGEIYTTAGGYTVTGDDLLKCIAVVSFPHSNKAAGQKMSLLADARIAWGGAEAVSAVSAFPSKYDCTDIILGPKLSFSVVANEELTDERKAKKLARKIAVDASVFDQTGCASSHNVFIEKNGSITPEQFAEMLGEAMAKTSIQISKGQMTPEEFAAIHSARGIYDFKGRVYGDSESVWTVLYSENLELNAPVYSRVLFVHPANSLDDVLPFITDDIQTIGLAATGYTATDFATKAAERGAVRFPNCGKMLNFESPWDGLFIMDRLVKWNTLGGPLV